MDGPRSRPRKPGRREWTRRLAWMAALWAGGVVSLAAVAYVIRVIMHALGMHHG